MNTLRVRIVPAHNRQAFKDGYVAAKNGMGKDTNPHTDYLAEHWADGYAQYFRFS